MSLRECLAVVLGTGPRGKGCLGLAEEILCRCAGGDPALVAEAAREPLVERAFFAAFESVASGRQMSLVGLGPAGHARILAAFEIGRRYALHRARQHPGRVRVGHLARQLIARVPDDLRHSAREWIGFVAVSVAGEVLDLWVVEHGARTHVQLDPAVLFARLLALAPAGFFLVHNHPSGNRTASDEDRRLTARIETLAEGLGVRLLGHLIVTAGGEGWVDLPST